MALVWRGVGGLLDGPLNWLTPYERFWRDRMAALGGVLDRIDDDVDE